MKTDRITCPYCAAKPGALCTTKTGYPTKYPHTARTNAARAAAAQPLTAAQEDTIRDAAAAHDPAYRIAREYNEGLRRAAQDAPAPAEANAPVVDAAQDAPAEYDEDAIGMPAVHYADRAVVDVDRARTRQETIDLHLAAGLSQASAEARTAEAMQQYDMPADPRLSPGANVFNAIPIIVKQAAHTRQDAIDTIAAHILEPRMLAAGQDAEDAESASRTAGRIAYELDGREIEIKHNYANPNNLRDWQQAQRDSAEARQAAGHAAQHAGHLAGIARYAEMPDQELTAERDRLDHLLTLSGIPGAAIQSTQDQLILISAEQDARDSATTYGRRIVDSATLAYRSARAEGGTEQTAYNAALAYAYGELDYNNVVAGPHTRAKIANAAHLAYSADPAPADPDSAVDPIVHYADRLAALAPNAESAAAYRRIAYYAALLKTADFDAARDAADVDAATWTPGAGHEPHTTPMIAALAEGTAHAQIRLTAIETKIRASFQPAPAPGSRRAPVGARAIQAKKREENVTEIESARAALDDLRARLREACQEQNEKNATADHRSELAAGHAIDTYAIMRRGGADDSRAALAAYRAAQDYGADERTADRAVDVARADYDQQEQQEQEARIDADRAAQGYGRPHPDTRDDYEPDPPYIQAIDPVEIYAADPPADRAALASLPQWSTVPAIPGRFIITGNLSRNLDNPISPYNPPAGYGADEYTIAQWTEDGFILTLWSTAPAGQRLNHDEQNPIAWRLVDAGQLIAEGLSFQPSPIHAWNAPQSYAALINFLTLKRGDTDADYFDGFSLDRLAWLDTMRPDELSLYGEELETMTHEQIPAHTKTAPAKPAYTIAELGTVSAATMRPEDLIPCFVDMLRYLDDDRAEGFSKEYADLTAQIAALPDDRHEQISRAKQSARLAVVEKNAPDLLETLRTIDPTRQDAPPAYAALAAWHKVQNNGAGDTAAYAAARAAALESGAAACYADAAATLASKIATAERAAYFTALNDHPLTDLEDAIGYLLNESMWDAMNDHAPHGASFQSHPGDGADYGYWLDDEHSQLYEETNAYSGHPSTYPNDDTCPVCNPPEDGAEEDSDEE